MPRCHTIIHNSDSDLTLPSLASRTLSSTDTPSSGMFPATERVSALFKGLWELQREPTTATISRSEDEKCSPLVIWRQLCTILLVKIASTNLIFFSQRSLNFPYLFCIQVKTKHDANNLAYTGVRLGRDNGRHHNLLSENIFILDSISPRAQTLLLAQSISVSIGIYNFIDKAFKSSQLKLVFL